MNDDETRIKAAFGRLELPEAPDRLKRRLAESATRQPTRGRAWRAWATVGAIATAAVLLLAGLGPAGSRDGRCTGWSALTFGGSATT